MWSVDESQIKRRITACRGYLVAEARNFVTEWYQLPTGVADECRTRVRELLSGDSFLFKEVQTGDASLKAWFVRDELFKLLRSHIFGKDSSIGRDKYTKRYFKPLRWPTVLLACTALRCALMDYEDTGRRGGVIAEFSGVGFSGGYTTYIHFIVHVDWVDLLSGIKIIMRDTVGLI